MNFPTDSVKHPAQLPMFQPDVIEVTMRVGVVHSAGHMQAQIEVRDPISGELLGMESWPHFELSSVDVMIIEVFRELAQVITHHCGPFSAC